MPTTARTTDRPLTEQGPAGEQFEDTQQQRAANLLGMWLFLATELLLFGGLFAGFVVYRFLYTEGFNEGSHLLSLPLGTLNTAVLMTSGLTMVLAEHTLDRGHRRLAIALLFATLALGMGFLSIKGVEWHHEYQEGLVPVLDLAFTHTGEHAQEVRLFFHFYFSLTGLHVLHMLVGMGLVTSVIVFMLRWRDPPRIARQLQIIGLYWAFVDVIWVIIFTLLYLASL